MNNQEHHSEESQIKLPKGVGLSSKLFMLVASGLVVVIALVVVMIFSYRRHKDLTPIENQQMLVTQKSGMTPETAIAQLNDHLNGVLIKPKASGITLPQSSGSAAPALPADSQGQSDIRIVALGVDQQKMLAQAARSPISVVNNYQASSQQYNTANSTSRLDQLQQQANNLNRMAESALNNLGGIGSAADYKQQNMQDQKAAFLKIDNKKNNFYIEQNLKKPVSPYEVKAATIIPATLITGIDSDLPGQITAQVAQNVFDTVTGNYLLIPQGTKIIGVYDSQVSYGQSRVLIAWNRLIYPNGDSFNLEGQPGVDLVGMAGLHDIVDNHYVRLFGSALAFSLFGALGQLSQPQSTNNTQPTNAEIIYGAIGQNTTQMGVQLTEKNLNIQPTIKIRPGALFNILLTRDMVLPGPYHGNQEFQPL